MTLLQVLLFAWHTFCIVAPVDQSVERLAANQPLQGRGLISNQSGLWVAGRLANYRRTVLGNLPKDKNLSARATRRPQSLKI